MKTSVVLIALFGLAVAPFQDDMEDEVEEKKIACDLKKIEKAPYCGSCWKIDPEVDDEGRCTECEELPKKVDVCVKVYYECNRCGKRLHKDKPHCKEAENKSVTVKARIVFRCEECGEDGTRDGEDCTNEECKEAAKKIRRTCEESGDWPHGGKSPAR